MRLRTLRALALASVFTLPAAVMPSFAPPAYARGAPDSFADLAEKLLPAVVNISSSQAAQTRADRSGPEVPQFPPGSPFEQFFRDLHGAQSAGSDAQPRAGSGPAGSAWAGAAG